MSRVSGTAEPIHVICAADANYGPYAGITMSSVLNRNPNEVINLHLFSDGIRPRDLNQFEKMASRFGAELAVYDVKQRLDAIPSLPKKIHHYTRTTYARLFFPDFLPAEVPRALYLDCDIICVSELRGLWSLGERVTLLGAVRDPWVDPDQEHKINLGIPSDRPYFNAGMLLINVEAWRRGKMGDRLIDFLTRPIKTKHADQDVLNGALWSEVVELPECWNTLVSLPGAEGTQAKFGRAANLHFCGGFKPWHLGYSMMVGTQSAVFRNAKAASPWRWMLADMQFGRLKKKTRQLIDRNFRQPMNLRVASKS
jgi:lipopolysaccharide biosynthesis glycosyltransferase